MDYNELKKIITNMTRSQRETEVVVFEEGSNRYIWPSGLQDSEALRPYLEGVAAKGDRGIQVFTPPRPNKDVSSVVAKPTQLDSEVPLKPDRVRAAHPSELDTAVIRDKSKKGKKRRK